MHARVGTMSEYGKRSTPVAAKVLSPETLERWRSRARGLLGDGASVPTESGSATAPETAAPADAAQRRRSARQKTLIGGQVVFNDMMSTYDCTIRDLSDSGARLKLNAPVQVPPVFILRFAGGQVRRCKLRRRVALELGVEFLD